MKHLAIFLLLLTSCAAFDPQAAMDRKNYRNKLKAEKKIAEAVLLDPSILTARVKTDTIRMFTPAYAGASQTPFTQADMDSVGEVWERLRLSYQSALKFTILSKEEAEARAAQSASDLYDLRKMVCRFDPLLVVDGPLDQKIWVEGGYIKEFHVITPMRVDTVIHTPELKVEVNPQQVEKPDARSGKVWWLLLLIAVLLVVVRYGRAILRKLKIVIPWLPILLFIPAQAQHDMPPPMNMVGAGYNLEYSAKVREASAWTFAAGGIATFILAAANDTRGTAAPWVAGGLTFAAVFSLNLHSAKWENRAGDLWKCGYTPFTLYETIPDSVDAGPLKQYRVPDMIDDTKIHQPERFR